MMGKLPRKFDAQRFKQTPKLCDLILIKPLIYNLENGGTAMGKQQGSLFHFYRFQLMPTQRSGQLRLFDRNYSVQDIIENKNRFLAETISDIDAFYHGTRVVNHRVVHNKPPYIAIKLNKYRQDTRGTKDFVLESYEDWPMVGIIINNDPTIQIIAIEHYWKAFSNTSVVANILEKNLNDNLAKYYLEISVNPIFVTSAFWELVERYKGNITKVRFEFTAPNLSDIEETIGEELQEFVAAINGTQGALELNSGSHSQLEISRKNDKVNSLVTASSRGGGRAFIKVKGLKTKITTSKSIVQQTIEELQVSTAKDEELVDSLAPYLTIETINQALKGGSSEALPSSEGAAKHDEKDTENS